MVWRAGVVAVFSEPSYAPGDDWLAEKTLPNCTPFRLLAVLPVDERTHRAIRYCRMEQGD